MSMILGLVALGDANIRRLLDDPPLIWRVVAPDNPEFYTAERMAGAKPSLLSRLTGRGKSWKKVPDLALLEGEGVRTDLDKSWHGIHYLLTGTAWEGDHPHNFLVIGGRFVGEIDVGYGPARVLTAEETREARDSLRALSDDELRARFDPQDMLSKEIYPTIWARPPESDDTLGYLMEYLAVVRSFLDEVVADGLGLVIYLS